MKTDDCRRFEMRGQRNMRPPGLNVSLYLL